MHIFATNQIYGHYFHILLTRIKYIQNGKSKQYKRCTVKIYLPLTHSRGFCVPTGSPVFLIPELFHICMFLLNQSMFIISRLKVETHDTVCRLVLDMMWWIAQVATIFFELVCDFYIFSLIVAGKIVHVWDVHLDMQLVDSKHS